MRKTLIATLLILSVLFIGCTQEGPEIEGKEEEVTLTISAAVSLTNVLEEIKDVYLAEKNVELIFILGGSGTLAQQIQQGAPADIFISANQDWMDTLETEELIIADTRVDFTGNKLVLIAEESSTIAYESFADISVSDVNNIAIGNPDSVPAGEYAKETLKNLDLWEVVQKKLVLAKDVRQVLTYVETGNADIGLVYSSDALSSNSIKVLATADKDLHNPIIYPAAVIKDTENEQAAKDFIVFLESDQAQEILASYGFLK